MASIASSIVEKGVFFGRCATLRRFGMSRGLVVSVLDLATARTVSFEDVVTARPTPGHHRYKAFDLQQPLRKKEYHNCYSREKNG
jgi:hypothetical protein